MLAHLGRPRGAVQADHVDAERLQRGEGGADLRAEQHGAGGLDGHGHDQRQVEAEGVQCPAGAEDGGLRLEQVLGGLDEQRVGAAGDQPLGVALVGVAQGGVRGVAQGGQLGAGAHGAEDPALPAVAAGELVGDLTGDPGARLGQLVHALGDVVLGHGRVVGPEGVGLDAVDAHREVRLMDGADDVGAGDVQDLVAALEVLEVLERGVLGLEHRAHRAVGHHDTGGEGFPERCGSGSAVGGDGGGGRVRQRGHGRCSLECDGCRLCASRGRRTRPG